MAKYRIVAVAEDRLLVRNFTCDSDEHAVEWAKQLIENHPIELWNHERLVDYCRLEEKRRSPEPLPPFLLKDAYWSGRQMAQSSRIERDFTLIPFKEDRKYALLRYLGLGERWPRIGTP